MTAAIAVLNTRRRPMSSLTRDQRLVRQAAHIRSRALQRPPLRALGQRAGGAVVIHRLPQPPQEPILALRALVGPLERLLRGRGEQHEQPGGIGTVLFHQALRVDAVVLGLGHRAQARRTPPAARRPASVAPVRLPAASCCTTTSAGLKYTRRPGARLAVVDLVEHHALRQQVAEGLGQRHQPHVAHHAGPEARIQQMQDGVLDAADVLIDRQPVLRALIDRRVRLVRAGEAQEIPGGIDEGVHGVGLAARALSAARAGAAHEGLALGQRIARAVGHQVLRQPHRQVGVGNRHLAAALAMNQRDRAAPVALARYAPVAQPPLHALCAQAALFERGGDRRRRGGGLQAREFAGIHA